MYHIWVPAVIVFYIGYAWLSKNYNDNPNWNNFLIIYATNLLPIWVFVARFTKNIVFDTLLYDLLMFISFNIGLLWLGCADKFSNGQWIGFLMVIIGFIIMKM